MSYPKRINVWSGPRNVSTALMYAFAQRSDTRVVDEPFYAHYLKQSRAEHPGRAEVLDTQPTDPGEVLTNLLTLGNNTDLLFVKNMAHHMIRMDSELERLRDQFEHVFLIRDPREMLISLDKSLPNPSLRDTAYKRQFKLFELINEQGQPLHVVDSRELLKNPAHVLSTLCQQLEISFEQSMLSWEAGPIPEDGVWAKHWYHNVHKSKGFKPYKPKEEPVPEHLKPLYEQCKPFYEQMLVHTIK